MPTYGASTLRGQAISNAFFWAIERSQDATFFHDWFTRAGQGAGGEYRFVTGEQSAGNVRFYRFNQQQTTFTDDDVVTVLPSSTSYELSGTATHMFGRTVRARGRLDYFSDIVSQQLYNQDIYQASRRSRIIEGSLSATLGRISTSALYQRSEVFNNSIQSTVYGSTPRLTASIAPQAVRSSRVYASATGEYAYLPYRSYTREVVTLDKSLGRVDASPTLRAPLSRLTFLSVNTSAAYRSTYFTKSTDSRGQIVDTPFLRQYLSLRSDLVGPVLTKIWDTPDSGLSERMKHVIEPTFTLDYTTPITEYRRAPVLSDVSDFIVGDSARLIYGVTNRLFLRRRPMGSVAAQTREFLTVGLQQTFYSNPEASRFDSTYASTLGQSLPTELSPLALTVRYSPAIGVDANGRVEYDVINGGGLKVLNTSATVSSGRSSATASYSRRSVVRGAPTDDYLSASTSLGFLEGRAKGTYALSWDIGRSTVVSQNLGGSYMAQCCGLQVEFQNFNYPEVPGFPIAADRRLNFSFVLAGLGTFSNFFGAFGQ
jgi:LPS-assembly protein